MYFTSAWVTPRKFIPAPRWGLGAGTGRHWEAMVDFVSHKPFLSFAAHCESSDFSKSVIETGGVSLAEEGGSE